MTNCMICLKAITETGSKSHSGYHDRCVRALFDSVKTAPQLLCTRAEFMRQAPGLVQGFSISGVQIKLQGYIDKNNQLSLRDHQGLYIIKPCPEELAEIPANEHLSMELARLCGFKVPRCGLIPFTDGSLAYIVRRYDRGDDGYSLHQEDLCQLMGISNEDSERKYTDASYQEVLSFIQHLTSEQVQALEYFRRQIFCYLIGNGDGHLKNTSFVLDENTRSTPSYRISPIYDVVNTALYGDIHCLSLDFFGEDREPVDFAEQGNGYYSTFDFVELGTSADLSERACKHAITVLLKKAPHMQGMITNSYLSDELKKTYREIFDDRALALSRGL
jgi:serine/threonine-protein kinase HipA